MIAGYLRDNIDRLARALPEHKPVPFLPERWYSAYGMYEDEVYGYWKMIDDTGSDKMGNVAAKIQQSMAIEESENIYE